MANTSKNSGTKPEKKFKHYLLAALCGVLTAILYLRINGPIYTILTETNAQAWVGHLPASLQGYGLLLHLFLLQVVILAVIIFLIVLIFGKISGIGVYAPTLISFVSYISTEIIFEFTATENPSFPTFPSLETVVLSAIMLLLFLVCYTFIAPRRKKD